MDTKEIKEGIKHRKTMEKRKVYRRKNKWTKEKCKQNTEAEGIRRGISETKN